MSEEQLWDTHFGDCDERELEILKRYRHRLQDLERWFSQQLEILAHDKQKELQLLHLARAKVTVPKLIRTRWGVLFA